MRKAVPGYTLIPDKGCYKARKIGIAGDRVKKDPAFAMTRRYAAEFGYAARIGKWIRAALKQQKPAGKCIGRLTSALRKALDTDSENMFGKRSLLHADLSSLVGFEFNPEYPWATAWPHHVEIAFLPGRRVQVRLPAFAPVSQLQQTAAAAYGRIGFRLIALDPVSEKVVTTAGDTGWWPYNSTRLSGYCFTWEQEKGNGFIYILCGYIEWSNILNGRRKPLAPCPLAIIAAWNSRTTQNNPEA